MATKHLTDAECAAEYWHAATYVHYAAEQIREGRRDPEFVIAAKLQLMEADIWRRFRALPHAHEED